MTQNISGVLPAALNKLILFCMVKIRVDVMSKALRDKLVNEDIHIACQMLILLL